MLNKSIPSINIFISESAWIVDTRFHSIEKVLSGPEMPKDRIAKLGASFW